MSAYHELIKNFEKIRSYMREFYVYGFKSREEYDKKSARSYDDERRRIESWLGDHVSFTRTPDGKNVYIAIDSRRVVPNPLFAAWKTKSFTDKDITLHFILFDILSDPSVALTLPEIIERIDGGYLCDFDEPLLYDESTLRKKLKEYEAEGIIVCERQGRRMCFRRAPTLAVTNAAEALRFFSEVAPCGVIGSFLLDKCKPEETGFSFKHHYITATPDSDVLATLFTAMQKKCAVSCNNLSRYAADASRLEMIPLRIMISVQNGRQHVMAYLPRYRQIRSLRLDYLSDVVLGEPCAGFDLWREHLDKMQKHMWGVNCKGGNTHLERVSFTVRCEPEESYIAGRLEREKRCGSVEQIDATHYRFFAEVHDSNEMLPWIRTFICRIEQISFSNATVEQRFRQDLAEMYRLYGIEGGDGCDIQ